MPIKSVHITNYYHKNSGGISTSYNKLLDAANRHERHVRLIVPGEETAVEEVGDFGRIYYIQANPSPVFDRRYRLMMPWKTFMPDGSPVKSILRRERPDLIEIGEKYTISLMAGLLRKRLMNVSPQRPVLVHSTCERMDDNVRSFIGKSKVVSWFARQYIGNYNIPMFDFHISNSTYTRQELIESALQRNRATLTSKFSEFCWNFWRSPKIDLNERLFINECGVDVDMFSPTRRSDRNRKTLLERFGLSENTNLLLYIGRISPEKNLILLPEIMRLLAVERIDHRLIIVGTGPFTETLRSLSAKRCPGKVIFAGQIADKHDLADIYANCDTFVHPNPHEPFGIAPLEAMASGLPLVAPDSGGVLSYATAENAWLSRPSAVDFCNSVRNVSVDRDLRQLRIGNALLTSQRYSWETSTDARFALYDRMFELFTTRQSLFDYVAEPVGIDYSI